MLLPRRWLGEQICRVLASADGVVVQHTSAVVVADADMLRPDLRDACCDMSEGTP